MTRPTVKFTKLRPTARMPEYQTGGSVGADLFSTEGGAILKGEVALIRTGLAVDIPDGYEIQVRLRSSMGKLGLIIPNGVGTIDRDYRGEIMMMVMNLTGGTWNYDTHQRIGQAIVAPVADAIWQETTGLDATLRGEGGFGSTGR